MVSERWFGITGASSEQGCGIGPARADHGRREPVTGTGRSQARAGHRHEPTTGAGRSRPAMGGLGSTNGAGCYSDGTEPEDSDATERAERAGAGDAAGAGGAGAAAGSGGAAAGSGGGEAAG